MKVILTTNVHGLGKTGDMVEVKNGYARNYLIPNKLAMIATTGNVKKLEHQKRIVASRIEKERKEAQAKAEKMESISVTIVRHAGEEDKLFGSVTARDIGDALHQEGVELDHNDITLEEPIKALGVYNVPIRLHSDVSVEIRVWVVGA